MLRLFQPRRPAADTDTAPAPADKPRHRRTASDGTHETDTEELSTLSATSSGVGRPAAADPHSPEKGTVVPGAPRVELLDMPGPSANTASTPVASGRKGKAGEDAAGEEDTPVVDLLGLRPYDHRSSPASVPDDGGSDDSSSCSEGGTADAHIYAADRLASLMSPPSSAPGAAGNPENNGTPAPSTPAADDSLDDSLRRSTETNALDSICTGDHVSAMLREYQGGGGSRWDRGGGSDGIGPSYTAEMQANIFKANIKAHKSLLSQIAEPDEVLTDTSDRPIRSRIQKKRRGREEGQQ
ncbi:hypothetical protein THAOC_21984 [Thalassiosira oceanica]|uniref:Uncharacterized protein n=1 Tax=Thalassiosira oceanica TaxID=159749 RepID=K0RY36_THAOC|nr:hypothetical protein THAOC_21984 [Thalassiosira oceanica]|eukprot:EJK57930.1 hypothetical protein THAOC_21984 [Thalassiosira oceanica]